MNDRTESSTGRCMTPEIARLIVDLTQRLEDAYAESDEAKADAARVREQRQILLHQIHEAGKADKRQKERIAALCDENRRLRAEIASWLKAAA